jgi:AraC-like DNA-binding protein
MKANIQDYAILIKKESFSHIAVTQKVFNEEIPLHWHNFYELELILDGEGVQFLNGKEYTVKRGSAYLLTPTDFHTVKALTPMKLWHVTFDEHILTEKRIFELSESNTKKIFSLDEKTIAHLSSLIELLREEAYIEYGCSRELCESLLSILLRKSSVTAGKEQTRNSGIHRALLYMALHFRENPTLEAVSRQAGFHPNYFSELFKESTGKNYKAHLTELKIEYAKNLLTAGVSVSDACYHSGFGSVSNFLSAFKRFVGMTPYEYKKTATV